MKKHISLILALILALSLLPGCTPADLALWEAMKRTNEAESYTLTSSLVWDVDVHEPIRTENTAYYSEAETLLSLMDLYGLGARNRDERSNSVLNILDLLAQDMTIDATTVKNGDDFKVDLRFAKPDLRLFFTFWQQMEEGAVARQIFKIPSLFISPATRGKEYLVMDIAAQAEDLQASTEYTESVGALVEYITNSLSSLAGKAEVTGNANVYTVHIDTPALLRIANEAIDAISTPEGAALVIDVYTKYMENVIAELETISDEDTEELIANMEFPTAEEARAIYDEAMKDAKLYAEAIGEQVEKSGLIKNGVTLKYTVNSDGLIEKTESEIVLDIDVEALSAAFAEILAIISGTGADTFTDPYTTTKGSFTVSFRSTSVYDYSPAEVVMPETNERNSVDIYTEQAEYQEYQNAQIEWNRKWQRYGIPIYLYDEENPDNLPLTVRNLANGKETVITPVRNEYGQIYFPVRALVNVLDDASVSWNQTLMAAELSAVVDGIKYTYIIPNEDGKAYYNAYFEGPWDWSDEDGKYLGDALSDEYIAEARKTFSWNEDDSEYYDWLLYSNSYYDETGTAYVAAFNTLAYRLGYVLNLEGTVLNIDFEENEQFEYDESIEDNFFYKLYDSIDSILFGLIYA